jgi:hypothetical protein
MIRENFFKKMKQTTFDQLPIFKEMSLYDIFSKEEVESLLKDRNFNSDSFDFSSESNTKNVRKHSINSSANKNSKLKSVNFSLMFDRMTLMMKLLHFSIEKLKSHKQKIACNGLKW